MERRSALLRVDHPLRSVATNRLGHLHRAFSEKISPPAFPAGGHIEQPIDDFNVTPLKSQALGLLWPKEPFFPGFEGDGHPAGEVAALDAQIGDLLGEMSTSLPLIPRLKKGRAIRCPR
jgi:hypothetical protein